MKHRCPKYVVDKLLPKIERKKHHNNLKKKNKATWLRHRSLTIGRKINRVHCCSHRTLTPIYSQTQNIRQHRSRSNKTNEKMHTFHHEDHSFNSMTSVHMYPFVIVVIVVLTILAFFFVLIYSIAKCIHKSLRYRYRFVSCMYLLFCTQTTHSASLARLILPHCIIRHFIIIFIFTFFFIWRLYDNITWTRYVRPYVNV